MKTVHNEKKKQGIKLVFSPEVILRKVSPPVLDFALPVPSTASHVLTYSLNEVWSE
jgi:hypothetical protein